MGEILNLLHFTDGHMAVSLDWTCPSPRQWDHLRSSLQKEPVPCSRLQSLICMWPQPVPANLISVPVTYSGPNASSAGVFPLRTLPPLCLLGRSYSNFYLNLFLPNHPKECLFASIFSEFFLRWKHPTTGNGCNGRAKCKWASWLADRCLTSGEMHTPKTSLLWLRTKLWKILNICILSLNPRINLKSKLKHLYMYTERHLEYIWRS